MRLSINFRNLAICLRTLILDIEGAQITKPYISMNIIDTLKDKVLAGGELSEAEAYFICDNADQYREQIHEAAAEITARFCEPVFDSCSIVNARSGKCPENCKWCAQSAHFHTKADVYPLIDREECMRHAEASISQGIGRFSMVTSGRKMQGAELERACTYYKELAEKGEIRLCASMGLLDKEDLRKLKDAGVIRYHCNLESAPSYFPTLCSTHTLADKIATIDAARELGMEICSGGIIGMGESARQRMEFALSLKRVAPKSIPINILCPIEGTPLAEASPLSAEEVLDTVAFFRFVHPRVTLRFAGGRAQLSRDVQLQAMHIGINGAIVGDLLTTVGSTVAADRQLAAEARLKFD